MKCVASLRPRVPPGEIAGLADRRWREGLLAEGSFAIMARMGFRRSTFRCLSAIAAALLTICAMLTDVGTVGDALQRDSSLQADSQNDGLPPQDALHSQRISPRAMRSEKLLGTVTSRICPPALVRAARSASTALIRKGPSPELRLHVLLCVWLA